MPTTISNSPHRSHPRQLARAAVGPGEDPARVRPTWRPPVREFLDAAWTVAAMGRCPGRRRERSRAFARLRGERLSAHRRRGGGDAGLGSPVVDVEPVEQRRADEVALAVTAGPHRCGNDDEIVALFAQLRAHVSDGRARGDRRRGQGHGRAHRRTLGEAEVPSTVAAAGQPPVPDAVTIYHGTCGAVWSRVVPPPRPRRSSSSPRPT